MPTARAEWYYDPKALHHQGLSVQRCDEGQPGPPTRLPDAETGPGLILAGQVMAGWGARRPSDDDVAVADLGSIFFAELATQDNAVYNQFIGIS